MAAICCMERHSVELALGPTIPDNLTRRCLNAGALRQAYGLCKAAHAHVFHHAAAVNLDRLLDRAEIVGDLLVEASRYHMPEHLALAGCERCEPRYEEVHLGASLSVPALAFPGTIDRCQQCVGIDRLGQKIDCACLHGSHGGRNIAPAGEKDHGALDTLRGQRLLQRQAVKIRHRHIEDGASRPGGVVLAQKIPGRGKFPAVIARCAQQPGERLKHISVIIDEKHRKGIFGHCAATMTLCAGSTKTARAPPVLLLTILRSPPWELMMVEQIESPRPRP